MRGASSAWAHEATRDIAQAPEASRVKRGLRAFEAGGQARNVAVQALVVMVAAREQHAQLLEVALVQSESGAKTLRQRPVDVDRRMRVGELFRWLEQGEIRPLPFTAVPFSEVQEAHRLLHSGATTGKLVLEV